MKLPIKEIADLQFGLYASSIEKGEASYLQAKHFDELGRRRGIIDSYIHIGSKEESHLLKEGDILFAGKGFRNFAWRYSKDFGPAIASSMFFVIRPDLKRIDPDYLTTIFNLPKNQVFFQQLGAGSSIPSIRKNELAEFKINLLPLEKQKTIVKINELHQKDMELTEAILKQKKELYQAAIANIIN